MKAQTLPEVIRAFDTRPLAGQELKEWFIDRPGNPMEEMKIYLQGLALADMPVKLLFTGHSGCGKSTVLNKLAEEIKKQLLLLRWGYDNEFLGVTEWRGGCPLCPRTALALQSGEVSHHFGPRSAQLWGPGH